VSGDDATEMPRRLYGTQAGSDGEDGQQVSLRRPF
jgi:hypothetical protein